MEKRDYLFLIIIAVLLLLTRLPLAAGYLYEWDSVQYALALEKYDVPLHQPHPPGYPFYVLAARGIDCFLHDAKSSLVTLSLLFSVLTLPFVYMLGKEMTSRRAAVAASILLFFSPVYWFYGEVTAVYAAEGMWAALVALACYRTLKGRPGWLFISAALLGIAGGFRGNIVYLLFPLWLYCALRGCRDGWKMFLGLLVLALAVASWLIPPLLLFGSDYIDASRLILSYSRGGSVFADPTGEWIANARRTILFTLYGFGPLYCLVLAWLLLTDIGKRRGEAGGLSAPFFLWWMLPPFCYYFFFHMGKPGYAMTYVPALALLLGILLCRRLSRRGTFVYIPILTAVLACNFLILFPPEGGGYAMAVATDRRLFSLRRLDDRKKNIMEVLRVAGERADRHTAVLSVDNKYTRFASYYLPECCVYHADFNRISPLVVHRDRAIVGTSENGVIHLVPEVDKIIVLGPADPLNFVDPGLRVEEVSSDPPVTVFMLSPEFQEVGYDQEVLGVGWRAVRIHRGGEL